MFFDSFIGGRENEGNPRGVNNERRVLGVPDKKAAEREAQRGNERATGNTFHAPDEGEHPKPGQAPVDQIIENETKTVLFDQERDHERDRIQCRLMGLGKKRIATVGERVPERKSAFANRISKITESGIKLLHGIPLRLHLLQQEREQYSAKNRYIKECKSPPLPSSCHKQFVSDDSAAMPAISDPI